MPIETFSYLDSLNASNPPATDGLVGGDDHIRGIKSALLATFPNLDGEVTGTPDELNDLTDGNLKAADGSSSAPSIGFKSGTDAGFYRASSGLIQIKGRLDGDGAVPPAAVIDYIGPADAGQIPAGWLECNGQLVSRTTYARLFALLGTFYGAGDGSTTFAVPDMRDRYRRSRGTISTYGSTQEDQYAAHSHTITVNSGGDHSHSASTSSSGDHQHEQFAAEVGTSGTNPALNSSNYPVGQLTAGNDFSYQIFGTATAANTGLTSTNGAHTHSVTVNSGGAHTHTASAANSGTGTETRPKTFVVVTLIKT